MLRAIRYAWAGVRSARTHEERIEALGRVALWRHLSRATLAEQLVASGAVS